MSTYTRVNSNLHYVEIPASEFGIKLWDQNIPIP